MTSLKIVQFSTPSPPPNPLVQLCPKFFHPLDHGRSISNKPLPPWSTFVFSINSLILSGFPFTSFHLAEANLFPRAVLKNQKPLFRFPLIANRRTGPKLTGSLTIYVFVALHSCVCSCPIISQNVFLKKAFFSTHFTINLFYLHTLKT